jgi:hypothetical protein
MFGWFDPSSSTLIRLNRRAWGWLPRLAFRAATIGSLSRRVSFPRYHSDSVLHLSVEKAAASPVGMEMERLGNSGTSFGVLDPSDGVFSAEPPIICLAADNQMHARGSVSLSLPLPRTTSAPIRLRCQLSTARSRFKVYGLLLCSCVRDDRENV